MYGLINNALRGYILQKSGRDCWDSIRMAIGLHGDHFGAMESYADSITYNIVQRYCEDVGRSAEVVLEEFGVFWVQEIAAREYGYMLKMTGRSFQECVENLDLMHERVATEFIDLAQPSFSVTNATEGSFQVHYRSHRNGLAPFVLGLLHGLASHFDAKVKIEHIASGHGTMNTEVFSIDYL